MKTKRFIAENMREALRVVRETLGSEAVIVTSNLHAKGVEVIASVGELQTKKENVILKPSAADKILTEPNAVHGKTAQILLSATQARAQTIKEIPMKKTMEEIVAPAPVQIQSTSEWIAETQVLHEVRNELQSIRDFLSAQMSGLAWQEFKRMKPMQLSLLRRFLGIGIESATAMYLLQKVEEDSDLHIAWNEALSVLSQEVSIEEISFRKQKDPIAFIGFSGAGKTSTLIKMAATLKMNKEKKKLLICSCVTNGVSPNASLRGYARLLEVPFTVVHNKAEYLQLIKMHSKDTIVLIDTPALNPISQEQSFPWVSLLERPKTLLVLPSSQQYAVLKKTIEVASSMMASGIILSKVDETALLGESLSALLGSKLPLIYYTDGQKISKSLHLPDLSVLFGKLLSMPLNIVQPEMAWIRQEQDVV